MSVSPSLQRVGVPTHLVVILCAAIFFLPSARVSARPKINEDAKRLAKILAPTAPAKSAQKDVGGLSSKMISIIEILEGSYRTNGPPPESLISKALEFREDMGRWESMMLTNSLLTNWREAQALGLFGENGKFSRRVEKGRGVGEPVSFEHIVPVESYPPASNQLANLQLVRKGEQREKDTPLTRREFSYKSQLEKMIEERREQSDQRAYAKKSVELPKQGPTNALGQTKAEQERLWNDAVERAGKEASSQLPSIRIAGRMEATPAHMTQHRWRVRIHVENISSYPTEVSTQVWLLGNTYKKREQYVMAESTHPMKLRPGESRTLDLYTKSENSYKGKADDLDELSKEERKRSKVRYRGFSAVVKHEKGVATFAGSDQPLTNYVNPAEAPSPLGAMPRF